MGTDHAVNDFLTSSGQNQSLNANVKDQKLSELSLMFLSYGAKCKTTNSVMIYEYDDMTLMF